MFLDNPDIGHDVSLLCFFTIQTLDMISRCCLYVAVAYPVPMPPFNMLEHNGLEPEDLFWACSVQISYSVFCRLQLPILGGDLRSGQAASCSFELKYRW
jgi:hypothetical protein